MTILLDNCEDKIKNTDKAIGIKLKNFDKMIWLPKSQIEINYKLRKIFIPDWLWDKKVDEIF